MSINLLSLIKYYNFFNTQMSLQFLEKSPICFIFLVYMFLDLQWLNLTDLPLDHDAKATFLE